jgi:threonine synthase
MTSQKGDNVNVVAIKGNFDDAQTGVKNIFSDTALRQELNEKGWFLSSANSINWGRLLPQIIYYFSAYCDLINEGTISNGEKINFCVPTGNFGDILAGYYAKLMGLPVGKLICASNRNDVLTEFINTGVYNRNRDFFTTISPSMDILVSSNLERLLYHMSGSDAETAGHMAKLAKTGSYTVSDTIRDKILGEFFADSCSDDETKSVIKDTFQKENYLIDTHTAVAYGVLKKYREKTGDNSLCVVVSTASPYKFADSVLNALGETTSENGVELIEKLSRVTGVTAPYPLSSLKGKAPRFTGVSDKENLIDEVRKFLV